MKRSVKHYTSKRFPTKTTGNFDIAGKMEELGIIGVGVIVGEFQTGAMKFHKTAV